jgi:hypothetical protein
MKWCTIEDFFCSVIIVGCGASIDIVLKLSRISQVKFVQN